MDERGELAALAERSAELLQLRGHAKGILEDAEGRLCLVGAVSAAKRELGTRPEIIDGLYTVMESLLAEDGDEIPRLSDFRIIDVVGWNNAAERTAEDVILLFKRAAARFREPVT